MWYILYLTDIRLVVVSWYRDFIIGFHCVLLWGFLSLREILKSLFLCSLRDSAYAWR